MFDRSGGTRWLRVRDCAVAALLLALVIATSAFVTHQGDHADHKRDRATVAPGLVGEVKKEPSRPLFGLATPGAPGDLASLRALAASLGESPRLVSWYEHWGFDTAFPVAGASAVDAMGALPEIAWMPWDPNVGATDPRYRLNSITSGNHDEYIAKWAKQIRSYGRPVVLRFAHEMNGDWYPWGVGINGNATADFAVAWRHVHSIFAGQRVTNVTWKWSPNVLWGPDDLRVLYPGDRYVDQVALDGYNWSTVKPDGSSSWQSFRAVFGPSITAVRNVTKRPLYIGEVGCPEIGGDKARWIREMFAELARQPDIHGFTWFDYDKETDWRIASSGRSLSSFRTGLASYRESVR